MNASEVKKASTKSLKWSFLGELFAKIAVPLSTIFLARLLSPEIYGIATAVTIIVTFCETILDNGFAKYLIQHDFVDDDDRKKAKNILFIFGFTVSLLICVLVFFFRYQLSSFVGNEGYEYVLVVASLQIPFASISSLISAELKRFFKFKKIFIVKIIFSTMPFIITLPLAMMGFGYWSLTIGSVVAQIVQCIILIILSKEKLLFYFSFKKLASILKIAGPMILESTIIWLCAWTSTLLASHFFNQSVVGLVKVSNSTVSSIFAIFSTSFTSILFPTLSRLKNNRNEYEESFFSIQQAAMSLLFPIGIGCFFYSDLITIILLGNEWMQASFIIGIFALTKPLTCCYNNFLSEVFRSRGNFYLSILYQLFMLVFDVSLKLIFGRQSFEAFVALNIITDLVINIIAILFLHFKYNFSFRKQFFSMKCALFCSLTMIPFLTLSSSNFIAQIIGIIVCILVYFATYELFFPEQFKKMLIYLKIDKKISATNKFNPIFSKLKKTFNRANPSVDKNKKISLIALFGCVSLVFISGIFTSSASYEQSAKYINEIINATNKDINISCSSKEEFPFEKAEQVSSYINDQFYDLFPSKSIIYSESNTDPYEINELGTLGENIKILPSSYFSNHKDNEKIIFDRYYAELMFEDSNTNRFGKYDNFVYLTKKQADYLLETTSATSYKDLIDTGLTLIFEGETYLWKIANIFNDCTFIQETENIFGNFVITYKSYLPVNIKNNIKILFNFSNYEFYNYNEIRIITSNFNYNDYIFTYYNYVKPESSNIENYYEKAIFPLNNQVDNVDWLFTISVVLSVIIFITSFYISNNCRKTKIYILLDFFVLMISWGTFKTISDLFFSINFFSYQSLIFYLLIFIATLIWSTYKNLNHRRIS